jgi:hypothetical protein
MCPHQQNNKKSLKNKNLGEREGAGAGGRNDLSLVCTYE